MRKIFTIAIIALSVNAFAQIPSSGLIGWYPFNGNANDESTNSNDGTVTGATLTIDRFGNTNSAYSFNGSTNFISVPNVAVQGANERTISFWIITNETSIPSSMIVSTGTDTDVNGANFNLRLDNSNRFIGFMGGNFTASGYDYYPSGTTVLNDDIWHNVIVTYSSDTIRFYVDGVIENTVVKSVSTVGQANYIGKSNDQYPNEAWYNGTIDDVGFWDRALSTNEISQVYNNGLCYQTITVTDTLIINANLTGFNPVTYQNSIKIYPNPTSEHITIDFGGNYSTMNGYTLKITNSLSQIVYTTPINTQTTTVELSTWSGNGIYFVHLIDASSNTIDIRKIVLQ